ncbi:MAG: DegT/DnrJ/EryC1/StrS family aminotransferase [Anaerolineae bacterium]
MQLAPLVTTIEELECKQSDGYANKFSSGLALIGLNQLKKIDSINEKRRQTAQVWDDWCRNNNYKPPTVIQNSIPVFLRYPIMIEPNKKADTRWVAKELKVELGVWFVSHLHPQNHYLVGFPNADKAIAQCVNLPGIIKC